MPLKPAAWSSAMPQSPSSPSTYKKRTYDPRHQYHDGDRLRPVVRGVSNALTSRVHIPAVPRSSMLRGAFVDTRLRVLQS